MVISPDGVSQDTVLFDEVRKRGLHCGVENGAFRDIETGLHPFGHMERDVFDHQLYPVAECAPIRWVHLDGPCKRAERKNLWYLITRGQPSDTPNHESQPVRLFDCMFEKLRVVSIDKGLELI